MADNEKVQFNVRIPGEVVEASRALAEINGISLAEFTTQALITAITTADPERVANSLEEKAQTFRDTADWIRDLK